LIDSAINEVLPKIYFALKECQDPIPMFGLKLLNAIIEKNPGYFARLKQVCAEQGDPNAV
jgi:hypothetical protein